MQPDQILLVQQSFSAVLPIADTAAVLFYNRLFELDPSLRPLFKEDMQDQRRKLMTTLTIVVRGLTRLDVLLPSVQMLGQRHVAYGVTDEHYATVGAALIWTLQQGLGETFTPDVEAAWVAAYTLLADAMQAAAYNLTPAMA
jgi:nitric oxide dioxygenase